MDPATIFQIAGAALTAAEKCYDVGKKVYNFVQDVRRFDDTAREFADEIDALGSACKLVDSLAKKIKQQYQDDPYAASDDAFKANPLWQCLGRQVRSCRNIIESLAAAASCIEDVSREPPDFFGKAWRQVKLNVKGPEINAIRERLKSHTAGLSLALHCVTVEAIWVIPRKVDDLIELRDELKELGTSRAQLEKLKAHRTSSHEPLQKDEAYILDESDRIKSSGQTYYNQSQYGGSTLGEPVPGRAEYIASWLRDADAIDEVVSGNTTTTDDYEDTPDAGFGSREIDLSDLDDETVPAVPHSAQQDDPDSDDESEDIDLARTLLQGGQEAYQKADYPEAIFYLTGGLDKVQRLPIDHRNICDTKHVRFMLSVCTFHTEPPVVAKEVLIVVMSKLQGSAPHMKDCLEAGSLLAQTHVRLAEWDQAREASKSTAEGRRRVFGKKHEAYWEALALRSRIDELAGNRLDAAGYARMIPEEHRERIIQQFEQLNVASSPKGATDSSSSSNRSRTDSSNSIPTDPLTPPSDLENWNGFKAESGRRDPPLPAQAANRRSRGSNSKDEPPAFRGAEYKERQASFSTLSSTFSVPASLPPEPFARAESSASALDSGKKPANVWSKAIFWKQKGSPELASGGFAMPGHHRVASEPIGLSGAANPSTASIPLPERPRRVPVPGAMNISSQSVPQVVNLTARRGTTASTNDQQKPLYIRIESRPLSHSRYLCISGDHLFCFKSLDKMTTCLQGGFEQCRTGCNDSLPLPSITAAVFQFPDKENTRADRLRLRYNTAVGPTPKIGSSAHWDIETGRGSQASVDAFARVLLNAVERVRMETSTKVREWRHVEEGVYMPSFRHMGCFFDRRVEGIRRMLQVVTVEEMARLLGWEQFLVDGTTVYEEVGRRVVFA